MNVLEQLRKTPVQATKKRFSVNKTEQQSRNLNLLMPDNQFGEEQERMKSKKISIIAALLMVFGLSTHALAEERFYMCTVEQVGIGAPFTYILLKEKDAAWGPVWFRFNPDYAKELLSIGLTAQIGNLLVYARVDPTAASSFINYMYLMKDN